MGRGLTRDDESNQGVVVSYVRSSASLYVLYARSEVFTISPLAFPYRLPRI